MRLFGWFSRKNDKAKRLMPESKWMVECEGEVLRATDDKQSVKQLAKSDLTGVIIETNDSGPWGADVWWLLFGPDDRVAIAYPQGATGEDAMLNYLMSLPGFDNEKTTEAIRSTDTPYFRCGDALNKRHRPMTAVSEDRAQRHFSPVAPVCVACYVNTHETLLLPRLTLRP